MPPKRKPPPDYQQQPWYRSAADRADGGKCDPNPGFGGPAHVAPHAAAATAAVTAAVTAAPTYELMAAAMLAQQRQQPQLWPTPGLSIPGFPCHPDINGLQGANFGYQQPQIQPPNGADLQMLRLMQVQQMASRLTADDGHPAAQDKPAAPMLCREFCIRDLVPRLGQTPGGCITFVIDMTDDQIVKGTQAVQAQLSSNGGQTWGPLSANPCTAPHGSPLVLQTKIMSQLKPGNYILRLHVIATSTSTQALPFEIKPQRQRQRAAGQSRRFSRKRKLDGKALVAHSVHVQQTVPQDSSASGTCSEGTGETGGESGSSHGQSVESPPMLVSGHEVEFMIQMVKPGALEQLTKDETQSDKSISIQDLVVRQLGHHFGPSLKDIWALYHPPHAVYGAPLGYHVHWMLIGACGPML